MTLLVPLPSNIFPTADSNHQSEHSRHVLPACTPNQYAYSRHVQNILPKSSHASSHVRLHTPENCQNHCDAGAAALPIRLKPHFCVFPDDGRAYQSSIETERLTAGGRVRGERRPSSWNPRTRPWRSTRGVKVYSNRSFEGGVRGRFL